MGWSNRPPHCAAGGQLEALEQQVRAEDYGQSGANGAETARRASLLEEPPPDCRTGRG